MPALPTKLCVYCGLAKPRLEFIGRGWCASCEEQFGDGLRETTEPPRRAQQRDYDRRKAAGLCVSCSNRARPGRVRCAACAAKRYERARTQRERFRAARARRN